MCVRIGRLRNGFGEKSPLALRFLLGACLWFADSNAWGAQFFISPDGSGDFPTIRDAVNAARSGDEIILRNGTFSGAGNDSVAVEGKAISIRSESGDPAQCIVDCLGEWGNAFQFAQARTGRSSLDGVTVTHGNYDLGGAMFAWYATVIVTNCIFVDNFGDQGGAMNLDNASAKFQNCTFIRNTAATYYIGGAVTVLFNSSAELVNCTVSDNTANSNRPDAAVFCYDNSSVTIRNSVVSGTQDGSAIRCEESSTATVICSDLFGNELGDWVGCVTGQDLLNGNFSLDPLFCGPASGNYFLRSDSPCAPPGVTGCGLVGALPVGCQPVSIQPMTWGKIKGLYYFK